MDVKNAAFSTKSTLSSESTPSTPSNESNELNRLVKQIRVRHGSDFAVYGENATIEEKDEWFNHPHSVTCGFLTLVWFIYAAFFSSVNNNTMTSIEQTKRGLQFGCIFFLVYCTLQLRDGHFIRPHPAVWRFITGLYILYEILLVFLLFQSTENARQVLKYFDPSLGQPLPSRDYATNCDIYTPTEGFGPFLQVLIDPFVPMHFFGWIIGALMVRSYIVCWCVSILFELYEITFQHWLPNFNECWWDHLILDIFLCNAAGIYCGMQICYYFQMKKFNWVGRQCVENSTNPLKRTIHPAQRAILHLLPNEWMLYDWKMFRSGQRFTKILIMIIALSVMILNSFFLKTILWIPTTNSFNVIRLLIWYSAGAYGVAEYYIFCVYTSKKKTQKVKKLGPRAWLSFLVVVTEVCIIIKHGKGMFTEPFPYPIKVTWFTVITVLSVLSIVYFNFYNKRKMNKKQGKKKMK